MKVNVIKTRQRQNGVWRSVVHADYAKDKTTGEKLGNKDQINFVFPMPKPTRKQPKVFERSELRISLELLTALAAKWGHKIKFNPVRYDQNMQVYLAKHIFCWAPRTIDYNQEQLDSGEEGVDIAECEAKIAEKTALIANYTDRLERLCALEGRLTMDEAKAQAIAEDEAEKQMTEENSSSDGSATINDLEALAEGFDFGVSSEEGEEEGEDLSGGL